MRNTKGQIIVSKHPWDYDPGTVFIMYLATPSEINALFHENFAQRSHGSLYFEGTSKTKTIMKPLNLISRSTRR
jgi:hypothetical protein